MEYTDTILIVDDSQMITKVLSFIVKKAGYHVLTAGDGKNALELLDGRAVDLVITDLHMPVMDGNQLICEIRKREHYRYLPVVLFNTDIEKNGKEILRTSGATMLFDKKNIKEKIISTIQKMLG